MTEWSYWAEILCVLSSNSCMTLHLVTKSLPCLFLGVARCWTSAIVSHLCSVSFDVSHLCSVSFDVFLFWSSVIEFEPWIQGMVRSWTLPIRGHSNQPLIGNIKGWQAVGMAHLAGDRALRGQQLRRYNIRVDNESLLIVTPLRLVEFSSVQMKAWQTSSKQEVNN